MRYTTTNHVEPDIATWIQGVSVTVDRPAMVAVTEEDVEDGPVRVVVNVLDADLDADLDASPVDETMSGDTVYAALRMVRSLPSAEPSEVEYGMGGPMVVIFYWHNNRYRLTLENLP